MKKTNLVKEKINELLDLGYIDKRKITDIVVKELDVPRPTVRRITREFRSDLLKKLLILQCDNMGDLFS